jgi:hypothetical protein
MVENILFDGPFIIYFNGQCKNHVIWICLLSFPKNQHIAFKLLTISFYLRAIIAYHRDLPIISWFFYAVFNLKKSTNLPNFIFLKLFFLDYLAVYLFIGSEEWVF